MRFRNNIVLTVVLAIISLNITAQQSGGYEEPALHDPASWSMIMLPDPQTYNKFDYNQPLLEYLTAWTVRYQQKLNIQMIVCTGDMVEQNDLPNPDGVNGNVPSKMQWEAAARAFSRIDNRIPYVLATGNHDFGFKAAETRLTNYDTYFPVDKNRLSQSLLRDVGVNHEGRPTLTNATYEFTSPHGRKFLLLVLEFAPRQEVLEWAKAIVDQEKYAKHTVILLTHSYLNAKSEHIVKEGYKITDANYGAAIWEKLVKPSKNILLVLSGHIGGVERPMDHLGFRVDTNSAGRKVTQMTFNAQALGGGWHGNGGDGWLRILEFLPDGKSISVKTFSPLFAASPTTQQFAWRTAQHDQFHIVLEQL